jgi:DNA-binding protein H-NS
LFSPEAYSLLYVPAAKTFGRMARRCCGLQAPTTEHNFYDPYQISVKGTIPPESQLLLRLTMAKKARRGRPPGSKNKKSVKANGSITKMDVGQLRSYIDSLQSVLAKKVNEQRAYFEHQLAQLGGYVSKKTSAAVKAVTPGKGRTGKRAKALPKYQSKKDRSVKWSGRGMTPVWMREEMKSTKLKKEDFLIS